MDFSFRESPEYGRNLRNIFLIFFGLYMAIVTSRFFSGQTNNTLVYFQHQLLGNIKQGSVIVSLLVNVISASILVFSVIVAVWFAAWLNSRCSYKFWIVILKYLPIALLLSLLPYCSFWLGTSLLTGLDPCFLSRVRIDAIANPWWNSCYFFIYMQLLLFYLIFCCFTPNISEIRAFFISFLALMFHLIFFFISCRFYVSSIIFYFIFNIGILLSYIIILAYLISSQK